MLTTLPPSPTAAMSKTVEGRELLDFAPQYQARPLDQPVALAVTAAVSTSVHALLSRVMISETPHPNLPSPSSSSFVPVSFYPATPHTAAEGALTTTAGRSTNYHCGTMAGNDPVHP